MFMVAVESTLANGVGGMVLFASEVSRFCKRQSWEPHGLYLVRNLNGHNWQHYIQIPPFSI